MTALPGQGPGARTSSTAGNVQYVIGADGKPREARLFQPRDSVSSLCKAARTAFAGKRVKHQASR